MVKNILSYNYLKILHPETVEMAPVALENKENQNCVENIFTAFLAI